MYQHCAEGGARSLYQRLAEGPESAIGRWDAAPDLERFLGSFYQYFEARGHRGSLARHLSHLAALAFTVGFSFTLLFFVDWQAILSCDSEESCRAVSLFYEHPWRGVRLWRWSVLLCFLLFFVYWVFNIVAAYHSIRDATEMSVYCKERLGIVSDEALMTMLWSEVVSRLIQQQKASPFCIVQDELTALEIANIIMREENFMIALTNHGTLTSRLPPWIPPRLAYTRAVLWNVRTAIFRWAFDRRSRICGEFLDRPADLAQRMRWLGLVNLLLVVPVLMFVTIYFFMRHAEEFRSHRTSPFRRQWTDYAKWTFREYNELPHQFGARMCSAQAAAEDYVRSTKAASPVLEAFQRFAKFVAGSILAVILVVALWDDSPLLFVKIWEKNLLWYLAFFGFLFAMADNAYGEEAEGGSLPFGRTSQSPSTPLRMHAAMMRLVKCTHFLPPSWRAPAPPDVLAGGCGGVRRAELCQHFERIRAEFLRNFFIHRIQALAEELLGVILTPLLLIVYLPEAAPDIVSVTRQATHESPNLGDWCAFGCLDPARNGSEFYGGLPAHRGAGAGGLGDEVLVSSGGKLEKSLISFILAHRLPWSHWQGGEGELRPGGQAPVAERLVPGDGRGGSGGASFMQRSFARATTAGAGDIAIPMRELGASATSWDAESPPPSEANPAPEEDAGGCVAVWGYPSSALRLLHDLEEFQRREFGPSAPHGRLYSLLPEDLLRLERVAPEPGVAPAPPAQVGDWSAGGDQEKGSCSSHFFWLEVLYDFHSGRQAAHLGEPAGGAGGPCGPASGDSEGAVFELLEREPGTGQA